LVSEGVTDPVTQDTNTADPSFLTIFFTPKKVAYIISTKLFMTVFFSPNWLA
jgi:hypothetical protein